MKNKKYVLALLIVVAIFSMNFGLKFMSAGFGDSTGAPMKTTVKSSYVGCNNSGCHTSKLLNDATQGFVDVTSDIPLTGWVPNTTYNITVTATAIGMYAYGFQFTTWGKTDSVTKGTLTAMDADVQIKKSILKSSKGATLDSNYYATHLKTSVTHGSTHNMWMFQWKAPAVKNQEVRFYLTAVCANGNGSAFGDYVYRINKNADSSSIKSLNINSVGIAELMMTDNVFIYPTITKNDINISIPNKLGEATVCVMDITGKMVLNTVLMLNENLHIINLSEFETGTYVITIQGSNFNFSKKVVKI